MHKTNTNEVSACERRFNDHLIDPHLCGFTFVESNTWVCHLPNPPHIMWHSQAVCHPRVQRIVSEISTLLVPIHTKPHIGVHSQEPSLMAFWFSLLAFSWRSSLRVHKHESVCVCFVAAGQNDAGKSGGGDKSCGADVPAASRASWMAAVVMVTGKRVGGLAYALQSSEWLEFNTVRKKSSCVQIGNKVASLWLFLCISTSVLFFLLFFIFLWKYSSNCIVILMWGKKHI